MTVHKDQLDVNSHVDHMEKYINCKRSIKFQYFNAVN
jgi:hypothetical protein